MMVAPIDVHVMISFCTLLRTALHCLVWGILLRSRKWDLLFEEHVGLLSWWFSPAPLQGFEFESTFLLSAAMFTMVGALPVLPGPCQLAWWKHISAEGGAIDMYGEGWSETH